MYKIYSESRGWIEAPEAEPVELSMNHGYKFIIHRSIDSGDWNTPPEKRPYVISETTSGSKVSQGRTKSQCISQAELKMLSVTKKVFDNKIQSMVDFIEFRERPFPKAVYEAGLNLTETELSDLENSLKKHNLIK